MESHVASTSDSAKEPNSTQQSLPLAGPVTRAQKRRQREAAHEHSTLQQPSTDQAATERRRLRLRPPPGPVEPSTCGLDLSLYVRWFSHTGKTKVSQLQLKPLATLQDLTGIGNKLVQAAFPEDDRPDYLVADSFQKFTPADEFMSLPGDVARTHFRLVAKTRDGWEVTVLERDLGAHRDPDRKMLVAVIEFESTALMVGHVGVRVSLIAYPVVSVNKAFLQEVKAQLDADFADEVDAP